MTSSPTPGSPAPRTDGGAGAAHPTPRHVRRVTWSVVVAAVVALGLYALVLMAYAQSTRTTERPELPATEGVSVYIEPYSVQPAERTIESAIAVVPPSSLVTADGRLSEDLVLTFYSEIGARVVTFEAGSPALALNQEDPAPLDTGSYSTYPLDRYSATFGIVSAVESESGTAWLPTQAAVWGDIPGWRTANQTFLAAPGASPSIGPPNPSDAATPVAISVDRAGSTVAIVVLLLLAMVAATVLGLGVATAMWQRKRRPEPTLAGWGAALLFAMVPLRLNMPGAPPIGAWIDFLVFLWVLLLLLVALAGIVWAWLKYGARPDHQHSPT